MHATLTPPPPAAPEKTINRFEGLIDPENPPLDVASLGEGLRLISDEKAELTIERAKEHLDLQKFDADRAIVVDHVRELLRAMTRRTFLGEQATIITCACEGVKYGMNGQHTCTARLQVEGTYRLFCRFIHYAAKSEEDMRRLYASIDRNKPRTARNVVVSYLYKKPEWEGYAQQTLTNLAEGLAFWLWDTPNKRRAHDADERAFLLTTDHHVVAKKVGDFLTESGKPTSRHLRRAPVWAAMFETFRKNAARSTEFWTTIHDGTGFGRAGDPRRLLRDTLMQASIPNNGSSKTTGKSVGSEQMYRYCIFAHNAWREDKTLKQLRAPIGTDRPVAI